MLLILLAGIALALALFAGLRLLERRDGRLTGHAVALSRNPVAAERDRAGARRWSRSGSRSPFGGRAWDQFSSSDLQFPDPAREALRPALRRRAPRLLPGRDRRLRGKAAARPRRRHLPVLLGAAALDRHCPSTTPTRSTCEAFAELGLVGGLLVLGLVGALLWTGFARLARGARAPARALRGAARGDARLRGRRRLRLVLGDRRPRRGLLPRRRRPRRRPLRAARRRRQAQRQSAERRRFGLAVSGLVLAWITAIGPGRAAAGRPRDRSRASTPPPTATSPAPSATPTPPARSSPGPPRPTCSSACSPQLQGELRGRDRAASRQAIEREDRNWQLYYLRSQGRARSRRSRRGAGRPAPRPSELNPLETCLQRRLGRLRMSRTAGPGRPRSARAASRPPPAGEPADNRRGPTSRPARADRAGGLAPARGAAAAAARRAATGLALIAALCVATATTSTTDVATLFWAVLFSPVWILVLKLHGLYDNDHRRIRHSTLDELSLAGLGQRPRHARPRRPAGAEPGRAALADAARSWSASAPSLGSFVARGVLRFLWHRLTGFAAGIVIGPAERRSTSSPAASRPTRRRACAWSATSRSTRPSEGRPRTGCRGSARSPTSPRSPTSTTIERVVVTEQEMSEPAAERLIEECKAAGLALTFLPQHYGLLGPGIELNRLAELPVLDFRFSDPPRSTDGDEAGDGRRRLGPPAGPALAAAGWRSRSRS